MCTVCIYIYTHMYVLAAMCVITHIYIYSIYIYTVYIQSLYIYSIHISYTTYIHAYMHACMHTYIHTYVRTYVHTYIRTYIHTYIHTFIHTYVHIYIHIYICIYNIHTYGTFGRKTTSIRVCGCVSCTVVHTLTCTLQGVNHQCNGVKGHQSSIRLRGWHSSWTGHSGHMWSVALQALPRHSGLKQPK